MLRIQSHQKECHEVIAVLTSWMFLRGRLDNGQSTTSTWTMLKSMYKTSLRYNLPRKNTTVLKTIFVFFSNPFFSRYALYPTNCNFKTIKKLKIQNYSFYQHQYNIINYVALHRPRIPVILHLESGDRQVQ